MYRLVPRGTVSAELQPPRKPDGLPGRETTGRFAGAAPFERPSPAGILWALRLARRPLLPTHGRTRRERAIWDVGSP